MAGADHKTQKKLAKAGVKLAKTEAKRMGGSRSDERTSRRKGDLASGLRELERLPSGVGVSLERTESGTRLVVSGLGDDQLRRVVPEIAREVLIAVTAERNALRAGLMRFVREGVFQTAVKIAAGLVVGYLLLRFGLR
jgi:hypothetical protein